MFFETFCSDRKRKSYWNVWFWLIFCMFLYIPALFIENFLLKQISVIGIIAVLVKSNWKISLRKSLLLAFLFQSLVLIVDFIAIMINNSLLPENLGQNQDSQSFQILFTKMMLFLLIILIKKIFGQYELQFIDDAMWLKFLFFPIFTICMIVTLMYKPGLMVNENQKEIFWVFGLGFVGINIMLFYLLQDVADKERKLFEQRIFEKEVKNRLSLYESVAEATKQQQALSHEYQNQFVCIQSLVHNKQYGELEEYLNKITGVVLKDLDYIDTNHAIINAIINEKYAQAISQGIVMVCKMNNLSMIPMEDQDIVLLLSNLLNNAMEACQRCENEKIIRLKFIVEDENIILAVKNTYDGHIIQVNDQYISTKKDKNNHGIGIKNMIQVIEKYDGCYSIKHDCTYFSFSCIIPR